MFFQRELWKRRTTRHCTSPFPEYVSFHGRVKTIIERQLCHSCIWHQSIFLASRDRMRVYQSTKDSTFSIGFAPNTTLQKSVKNSSLKANLQLSGLNKYKFEQHEYSSCPRKQFHQLIYHACCVLVVNRFQVHTYTSRGTSLCMDDMYSISSIASLRIFVFIEVIVVSKR